MARLLDYASRKPRPRPAGITFAVAAVWWSAALIWLVDSVRWLRMPPPADSADWLRCVAALVVLAAISALLWMSLCRASAAATRLLVSLLPIVVLVILFIGFASALTALVGSERLEVVAIIFGATLGLAAFAGFSAWRFRCWLDQIELTAD